MRATLRLTGDRSLIAAYTLSPTPGAPWLVYLPESGAGFYTGSRAELSRLLSPGLARRFSYLAINKPGVGPRQRDPAQFERSFRRDRRVEDALETMRRLIPQTAKIYLVGYSEGAYLAPEIALADPRVVAVAMIGGGTRGWLDEELNRPLPKDRGQAIRREIQKILANPLGPKKWQGFSFATWASFNNDRTLTALEQLGVPTLAILGARDRVIDFKTTLADLKTLSATRPLQIEVLEKCGHSFVNHWGDVSFLLEEFFNPGASNPDLNLR